MKKLVIVGGLLLGTVAPSLMPATVGLRPASAGTTRPNIVIIMSDDQRWDTIGDMPAVMSRIADEGVVFANAMVPTSLCCPSRASTLVGRYAHGTQVWDNELPHGGWKRFFELGHERSNIATWLDASGYRTAFMGKYLNGFSAAPRRHVPRGWDIWRGLRRSAYFDYDLQIGKKRIRHYGDRAADYSTDVLARMASRFISASDPRDPFFLYLTPVGVHGPRTAAPRHEGSCWGLEPGRPLSFGEQDLRDKPRWLASVDPFTERTAVQIDRARRKVCQTLGSVDDLVDTVLDALAATDRLSNTLVIYMSDNGFLWGEHRLKGKYYPYDAATRIPMAIRFDGRIDPGTTDRRLALNIDIAKTVLDAAGASATTPLDGRSLLRSWRRSGFVLEGIKELRAFGVRPAYCGWRTKKASYVRYADGDAEFYDLRADPWELDNLIRSRADRDRIRAFRRRARAACDPEPPGFHW
jgi:arylsulfatase A-like enzyme